MKNSQVAISRQPACESINLTREEVELDGCVCDTDTVVREGFTGAERSGLEEEAREWVGVGIW